MWYPRKAIIFVDTEFHSLPVQNGVIIGEQLKVSIFITISLWENVPFKK